MQLSRVCAFVQAVQILREWIGNGFSAVTFFRVLRCDNIYQQGADLCKALLQVRSASDEISASDINLLPSCAYASGEPRFSTRKVGGKTCCLEIYLRLLAQCRLMWWQVLC